ncbi:cbb3-type cytochrome oxidase subunit 3 [Usitatibacter palustris]|uniref:Cytochrome c oxidase cbb3-type subunit 4 n=1 Tax=Usitatibacter palustris TaxID=2732487 RepID=A0A6M4H4Y5_9PROT|nr:cbb3-type cytochrome c oxidase subunit 3 [Usitatibacter palustris]QJR14225.1 hypothetical protein DSM104440_01018 [Usitatibacter palustris]
MDLNTIRVTVEVITFASFLGIVAWAWWPTHRAYYERAAAIPLNDE